MGEDELPVTVGDMATTRIPGEFSLVYLVHNTIGNLRTQAEQAPASATPPTTSRPAAGS